MAESESAAPASTQGAPVSERPRPATLGARVPAIVGLAVAVLIVAAALAIGARSGWDSIGSGGINQSLLPKVGEVAPDFETEDVFGNPVRLSQFRGQPVWLMFWGSWCPPCRAEFPDIQAAYAQLEPQRTAHARRQPARVSSRRRGLCRSERRHISGLERSRRARHRGRRTPSSTSQPTSSSTATA